MGIGCGDRRPISSRTLTTDRRPHLFPVADFGTHAALFAPDFAATATAAATCHREYSLNAIRVGGELGSVNLRTCPAGDKGGKGSG